MKKVILGTLFFATCLSTSAQKAIAVNAGDIAPLSFYENGKPTGIAVDILNEVAKEGQYSFQFTFSPWLRAQMETQRSAAGIVPLTRTTEREGKYTWIAELFQQNLVFVTVNGTPPPRTMADVVKLRVGLLRGNQVEQSLRASGVQVDLVTSEMQNVQKLKAKHIDAWLVSEFVAPHLWKSVGGSVRELSFGMRFGNVAKVFFAGGENFSKQDADAIHAAISNLRKDGTIDKILEKYRRQ